LNKDWIAGFFEGEGCLGCGESEGYWKFSVDIVQKRPQVLWRIQDYFREPLAPLEFRLIPNGSNSTWALRLTVHEDILSFINHVGSKLVEKRREALAMQEAILRVQNNKTSRVGFDRVVDTLCYSIIAMKGRNSRDALGDGVPVTKRKLEEYLDRRNRPEISNPNEKRREPGSSAVPPERDGLQGLPDDFLGSDPRHI